MAPATIPSITLNNGTTIPQFGFGTLNMQPDTQDTPENARVTADIVGQALELGYRHIDSAQSYGTERGVGEAVRASGIPRDEIYVTSKLSNRNHRPEDVKRSFNETMDRLGLDYLDLFLIHWPLPSLYDGDYVSTWRAMVDLLADGRLRSAGVSNFQPDHLHRIIAETGVVPAVNQIEVHPYFGNTEAAAACVRHGITVESWSPLSQGNLLDDAVLGRIAAAHGKTPAQIVLRWHVEHGYVVIPKSSNRQRMQENISIFDFQLNTEEVAAIDALDRGEAGRRGPNPDTFAFLP